jgi:hypothetical protein
VQATLGGRVTQLHSSGFQTAFFKSKIGEGGARPRRSMRIRSGGRAGHAWSKRDPAINQRCAIWFRAKLKDTSPDGAVTVRRLRYSERVVEVWCPDRHS